MPHLEECEQSAKAHLGLLTETIELRGLRGEPARGGGEGLSTKFSHRLQPGILHRTGEGFFLAPISKKKKEKANPW